MSSSPNTNGLRRPLKGSWEAMLQEAHGLAKRDDDRAVVHYWRLIDRLGNFPSERRLAGQGQLQAYLEDALFSAQAYLAGRGRFAEAQEFFLDRVADFLDEETMADWRVNRAKLLSWSGENEAAIHLIQQEVSRWPLDIPARWLLFDLYVDAGNLAGAEALADDLNAVIQMHDVDSGEADLLELHRALVFYLRAALALEQQMWEDAFEHFRRAAEESETYRDSWQMFYRPLILHGQHEWANRALQREASEASQRFWRGLNSYYAGDESGAKAEWQRAASLDIGQVWVRSAADWIQAHYYLGDEKREGLDLTLRLLSRPQHEPEPIMLLLAALGWAIRDDWAHTRLNLDFALARYRSNLQGALLPEIYSLIARDLVGPEKFTEIEGYFQRRAGKNEE